MYGVRQSKLDPFYDFIIQCLNAGWSKSKTVKAIYEKEYSGLVSNAFEHLSWDNTGQTYRNSINYIIHGGIKMTEASKEYYGLLEVNIESLPLEWREKIYYQCAVNCVKDGVLQEEKKHFDECNGDMDLIYEKYGQTEYNYRKVIEKGHIYELGFPRCLCYLVDEGISKTSGHCECSRQSIIYILHELMPNKNVKVETIETVLGGAEQCRFRIVVE